MEPLKGDLMVPIILPGQSRIGGLYIGDFQSPNNKGALRKYGITAVLSVVHEMRLEIPGVQHRQIDIKDDVHENLARYFLSAFAFISTQRKVGNVLVHCVAGISRSPAIVIGYIMTSRQAAYEQALLFVKKRKPDIKPNDGFVKQLMILQGQIKAIRLRKMKELELKNNPQQN